MNDREDDRELDALMARASELPKAVRPERDLWPEIEQVITGPMVPRRGNLGFGWAQAAMVLLLVGASSGITWLATSNPADPTTPVATPGPLVFETATASFGAEWSLGPAYVETREALADTFEARLETLPPETRDAVRANLETIRQAIGNINGALATEPNNVLLQELLLDTYRDELDLMIKVDDLTRAAMRRGDI